MLSMKKSWNFQGDEGTPNAKGSLDTNSKESLRRFVTVSARNTPQGDLPSGQSRKCPLKTQEKLKTVPLPI
jgi:hypothetical protein